MPARKLIRNLVSPTTSQALFFFFEKLVKKILKGKNWSVILPCWKFWITSLCPSRKKFILDIFQLFYSEIKKKFKKICCSGKIDPLGGCCRNARIHFNRNNFRRANIFLTRFIRFGIVGSSSWMREIRLTSGNLIGALIWKMDPKNFGGLNEKIIFTHQS